MSTLPLTPPAEHEVNFTSSTLTTLRLPPTHRHPPRHLALPLLNFNPVNVTSDPPSILNIPPFPELNDRSDVSTAPVLLLILTPVLPEIAIAAVNVMSLTTLISASVSIALESAENVDTSVLRSRRVDRPNGPGAYPLAFTHGPSACPRPRSTAALTDPSKTPKSKR